MLVYVHNHSLCGVDSCALVNRKLLRYQTATPTGRRSGAMSIDTSDVCFRASMFAIAATAEETIARIMKLIGFEQSKINALQGTWRQTLSAP